MLCFLRINVYIYIFNFKSLSKSKQFYMFWYGVRRKGGWRIFPQIGVMREENRPRKNNQRERFIVDGSNHWFHMCKIDISLSGVLCNLIDISHRSMNKVGISSTHTCQPILTAPAASMSPIRALLIEPPPSTTRTLSDPSSCISRCRTRGLFSKHLTVSTRPEKRKTPPQSLINKNQQTAVVLLASYHQYCCCCCCQPCLYIYILTTLCRYFYIDHFVLIKQPYYSYMSFGLVSICYQSSHCHTHSFGTRFHVSY